ncbi:MAG: TonB-dependent receptor [Deltaproteobacteria bacterium]|nr:TonB-dependent receptor [Deltaproteobacteria bacterium]
MPSLLLCAAWLLADPSTAPSSEPASEAAGPTSAPSEEPSLDVFDILNEEQEVFTGARGVTKVRESGSNVWVIDRATIDAIAATSLPDVLRLIPGIYVREINPSFVETHTRFPVIIPDNQTLFMIDGRSQQFDVFGYTDKMGIELGDVERIEVIMGPSSTLYGTNAYAGVVNIVTKSAAQDGAHTNLSVRGGLATGASGEPGSTPSGAWQPLARAFVDTSYGSERFGFRASVGADYLPAFVPALRFDNVSTKEITPHGRVNASLDFSERASGWSLRQRVAATVHNAVFTAEKPALIRFQDYSLTVHASRPNLAKEGDELSFIVWGRFVGVDHTFIRDNIVPLSFSSRSGTSEIFAQYRTPKFLLNNQLSVGTQIRFAYIGQQGIPEDARFQHVYGLFAEDTWRPIDKLVFTLGARIETNESPRLRAFSRFNVAPRGSIVWLVNDDHALRLEAASAFRNPSVFESFSDAIAEDGLPWYHGNPTTRSEQILQISLGYNGRIDWLKMRAEILAVRVTNVIIPQRVGANSDVTEIFGYPVDVYEGQSKKLPDVFGNLPDVFWIPAASLRLEADIKKMAKVWAYYHYTPMRPEHMAGLGAQLNVGRFVASTQLYYLDPFLDFGANPKTPGTSEYAGRVIWNAQLAVAIDDAERFKLVASGTNLLDLRVFRYAVTKHVLRDNQSGERIGQRFWIELRASF